MLRKVLTMHDTHHPHADTDCLDMKRTNGGRGLKSVEDCVHIKLESLMRYLAQSKGTLVVIVKNKRILRAERKKKEKQGKKYKKDMKENYARRDYTIS